MDKVLKLYKQAGHCHACFGLVISAATSTDDPERLADPDARVPVPLSAAKAAAQRPGQSAACVTAAESLRPTSNILTRWLVTSGCKLAMTQAELGKLLKY